MMQRRQPSRARREPPAADDPLSRMLARAEGLQAGRPARAWLLGLLRTGESTAQAGREEGK